MPTKKRKKPVKAGPRKLPEVRAVFFPKEHPISDINKVTDLSEEDIANSHARERDKNH